MSDPYNEFAVFERARVIAGRLFIFVYLVRTCCEMTSTARSITVHFHVEGSLPRHRILGTHSIAVHKLSAEAACLYPLPMSAGYEPLAAAVKICIICSFPDIANHHRGHGTALHHEESNATFRDAPRSCHSSHRRSTAQPRFLAQMFTLLGVGSSQMRRSGRVDKTPQAK